MRIGACVLLLAVLAGCEGPDDEGVVSAPLRVCAAGPTTEGIDVSHWQGTIDWDDVAASGVRFAFVRVSDGLEYPDAEFDRNWAEARRVGLYRGAYQYFRASQDPIEQADYLLEHMGPLEPDDLPPVIDFEGDDGATLDEVQHGVRAWIAYVQAATGRRPIVYSGRYAWPDTGLMDVTPSVLWVPQYGRICPDIPAPWTRWAFFQYTGSGAIDGIAGRVDLDRFDGDEAALRAFIGVDARCGDGLCTGAESCAEDCPSCEPIPPEGRTIEETELCFERWGPASGYRMVDGEGSGDSLLFTYAIEPPSKLYAYWHFDVEEAGRYRLEVHTPAPYNETRAAPYVVRHAGIEESVTLDQSLLDGWQVLGEYELAAAGDQWLMIADGTGEPSDDHIRVVMDAVRLTRTDLAVLDAGVEDAGMPDGGPDAGVSDAGMEDARAPPVDAAMQPDVRVLRGTCGCRVAGARDRTPLWLALAPLALLLRRARS